MQTVLVVEDNDVTHEGFAVILQREGCRVVVAENGEGEACVC